MQIPRAPDDLSVGGRGCSSKTQAWKLVNSSGGGAFVSAQSGLCLEAAAGGRVVQAVCDRARSGQRWAANTSSGAIMLAGGQGQQRAVLSTMMCLARLSLHFSVNLK